MLPYLLESIIYLFFYSKQKRISKIVRLHKQFAFATNNIANISLVI